MQNEKSYADVPLKAKSGKIMRRVLTEIAAGSNDTSVVDSLVAGRR